MPNKSHLSILPVSYRLESLQISGLKLGNPQAPVVLCLHGWLDNAASYMPLFEHLIRSSPTLLEQYQFIAIDWPGHGLSDHRSVDAHYHFIDWSYDLLQLISSQQLLSESDGFSPWYKVHIVGHSMGGMVASLFASAFNEKVASLTLIEAMGLITASKSADKQLRQGLLSRIKGTKKQQSIYSHSDVAVQARVNVSDLPVYCAKLIVERSLNAVENGFVWRSDHRLRTISAQRFSLQQAIEISENINCPLQLVKGTKGFTSIKEAENIFAQYINAFSQYTIMGGHHPHMESPDVMANILNTFLNKKIN